MKRAALFALAPLLALPACRDISRFSSGGDRFEGSVATGSFVRANIAEDARVCLTLDADHLQDAPGKISLSDGRFHAEPLRPIPQVWHDPISTLSFGQGRDKNLLYVATSATDGGDVFVVVSLMSDGSVEVRLLRGAPGGDAGDASNLFAVFALTRRDGPCSF